MKQPSKDKMAAAVKLAVEQTKQKPASGVVCAIASLRILRDSLIDDIYGTKPDYGDDAGAVEAIRESFLECIKDVAANGANNGFASNASAAAKAAGYKAESVVNAVELSD